MPENLLRHFFFIRWRHRKKAAAAAAAKSLQLRPTLCNPREGNPPGSPVPGILQARTLEWVAISFSSAWKWKAKVKSCSRVWPSATPWTTAFQAPPSMGFSRQEYWSGVPLPSQQKEGSHLQIWKRVLLRNWICWHLLQWFLAPRTVTKQKCLLFKPPSLWWFMAAWDDQDNRFLEPGCRLVFWGPLFNPLELVSPETLWLCFYFLLVVVALVYSLSHVWLFATHGCKAHQAPLSMGFSGKHTGVGCHFLLPGIFPTQGLILWLLHLLHWQTDSLPLCHLGSPFFFTTEPPRPGLNNKKKKQTNTKLGRLVLSPLPLNFWMLVLNSPWNSNSQLS